MVAGNEGLRCLCLNARRRGGNEVEVGSTRTMRCEGSVGTCGGEGNWYLMFDPHRN